MECALVDAGERLDPRSTSSVDRHIGTRIRARRLEIRMSQESLADAIGVTFQQVQKYEKGVNRVSASTLFRIARVLDAELVAFLPTERASKSATDAMTVDSSAFAELGATFARLNEEGRRLLITTARTFASEPRLLAKPRK